KTVTHTLPDTTTVPRHTQPKPKTTGTSTGGAQTGSSTATGTSVPTSTTTTPPPPKPARHLSTFESPSGNIGCVIAGGQARCDIRQRNWSPPPKPPGCPPVVGFGQGMLVDDHGVGHFVCAGDTALDPSAPKLGYGAATVVAQFKCTSAFVGMTCTDTNTGHGFFLSRQGYRSF